MSNIILPDLPYSKSDLEPYISSKTLELHHGKHHNTYVVNLNNFIKGTNLENLDLEEIVKKTANDDSKKAIFNNAGQAWNHNLYWKSMKKNGGGKPPDSLLNLIEESFNSFDLFIDEFTKKSVAHFGSGWSWLIKKNNKLQIETTINADSPFAHGIDTLFGIDVWEHAYYLDYQNRRIEYIKSFLNNLINWDFIASRI